MQRQDKQPFRDSISVEQLDEEASETFVFREVAERRPSPRLKGFVRKVIKEEKRKSVFDVMNTLQHNASRESARDDWMDQIVPHDEREKDAGETSFSDDESESIPNILSDETLKAGGDSFRPMRIVLNSVQATRQEKQPLISVRSERSAVKPSRRRSNLKRKTAKWAKKVHWFLRQVFWHLRFAWLALPLTGLSSLLFYKLGNPSPDFLPGNLTLSWLGNFAARHIVLVSASQLIQFLWLDCFLLRVRQAIRINGPLVTLTSSQAKGWPFIFVSWSILALFLLHGNNTFQCHWFYWTNWAVYSTANSGSYILNTRQYHRVLMGLLLSGIATTIKRTYLTVTFGNRQLQFFRPRLERLLKEVLVVSEIALLSSHSIDEQGHRRSPSQSTKAFLTSGKRKNIKDTLIALKKEMSVAELSLDLDDEDEDDTESESIDTGTTQGTRRQLGQVSPTASQKEFHQKMMKNQLERWEEPERDDGQHDFICSIEDVLRFKRALGYMDHEFPFGDDFGLAPNRNQCVSSSQRLFERLTALHDPENQGLPFSCFDPLVVDSSGTIDRNKRTLIRNLFPPNSSERLDTFAFVQSVDSVYRRLRYFGASVRNDASLDQVLERILNGFYYFVLGLFLVSILNFNPWSMLVSITSLLVSLSFAFGQTVAGYVQGILTVATSRPYDLGDRIYLGSLGESGLHDDISGASWFVEAVTLSTTKLRYATTGEVMYLSNRLISSFRVYNCNRSSNACVTFPLEFSISLLEGNMLKQLKDKLFKYVTDNQRRWDGVQFVRIEKIDPAQEMVTVMISVRHRCSWQDASRIKKDKGSLMRSFYQAAKDLGLGLNVPPSRSVLYHGGVLKDSAGRPNRMDLLRPDNIVNGKAL